MIQFFWTRLPPPCLILCLLPLMSFAEEFTVIGPRAMGMGGAGVATTRGSLSTYWNPAALAPPRRPQFDPVFDVSMHAGFKLSATKNILAKVDSLLESANLLDRDELRDSLMNREGLADSTVQGIMGVLESIPPLFVTGTGLLGNVTPGLSVKYDQFGFNALAMVNSGGVTNVDLAFLALGNQGIEFVIPGGHSAESGEAADLLAQAFANIGVDDPARVADELIYQAEQAGVDVTSQEFQNLLIRVVEATEEAEGGGPVDEFLSNNRTGVNLRSIVLQEYAFAYGHPFGRWVSVGVAPKILYGKTYFNPIRVFELGNFDGLSDEIFGKARTDDSVEFSIDAGLLVTPAEWLSLGLVGKYLNGPSFAFAADGRYEIDSQFRAGIGYTGIKNWTLAMDFDVTRNTSAALPGYDSQMIGGGFEYNMDNWMFYRGGLSKNMAESDQGLVIHMGLGMRFGTPSSQYLSVELGGMLSTDTTKIDTQDDLRVPDQAGISIQVSYNLPLP